ncbi:MAG: hypothetical protein WDN06_02190 [Asticcacaulis sp.]
MICANLASLSLRGSVRIKRSSSATTTAVVRLSPRAFGQLPRQIVGAFVLDVQRHDALLSSYFSRMEENDN